MNYFKPFIKRAKFGIFTHMKTLKKYSLISILNMFLFMNLNGQVNFTRNDSIIVIDINGDSLKNAWAGGLNYVQLSEIDMNLDGIKDLFVFDRSGNRISTFINEGIANTVSYRHEPQYIQNFQQTYTIGSC